jgi:hypothetical protein
MRTPPSGVVLGAALALLALAGCGYDPHPVSGALKCGADDTCPEGYECAEGACWRPNFYGTWTFITPSTRKIVCDGGTTTMTDDWGDIGEFFDITKAGSGGLRAYYYCDWDLNPSAGGNSTVIQPGQSCSGLDPTDSTISYTWHGETFALSSSDGHKGTIAASLPYDYVTLTGSGSCTMNFTGTLTKN